jgi:hypothetical protein
MPYYEVIFETGEHSIAFYEDDNEAASALAAHHSRALKGELFQTRSPQDTPAGPATRIKRVFKYDEHPVEYTASGLVSVDEAKAAIDRVAVGDQVSVWESSAAIRELVNAEVNTAPHESNYKAPESGELDSSVWEGSAV